MKLIYWRCFALLLSWALLCFGLMLINHAPRIDPATFGAILIASAGYLFGSAALLKPFTHPRGLQPFKQSTHNPK